MPETLIKKGEKNHGKSIKNKWSELRKDNKSFKWVFMNYMKARLMQIAKYKLFQIHKFDCG